MEYFVLFQLYGIYSQSPIMANAISWICFLWCFTCTQWYNCKWTI